MAAWWLYDSLEENLLFIIYIDKLSRVKKELTLIKNQLVSKRNKTEHAVHSYTAGQGYFSAMLSSAQQC